MAMATPPRQWNTVITMIRHSVTVIRRLLCTCSRGRGGRRGEVINEDEIEAAQAENIRLANSWLLCEEECEGKAGGDFEGVHFHWIMEEVDAGEIEGIASDGGSEGETPDAGPMTGADGETSYAKSGCQEDCGQTYEKFISMKYSYTWKEFKARDGYILHDEHADDLPIEIITTDASEHGANAAFGGGYSRDVVLGTKSVRRSQGIGEASGNQNGESEAKAGISEKMAGIVEVRLAGRSGKI